MSRLDFVGIGKQAAFGTPQATPEYYVPVESAEFNQQAETLEQEETTGTRFPTRMERGSRYFEVPLLGAVRPASFPRIASAFLGAPTSSQPDAGGAPTAYSHLFDPAAAAGLVYHSVLGAREDPSTAFADLYTDAAGNELELSVEANGFVKFNAAMIAAGLTEDVAVPSPSTDLSKRFTFDQAHAYVSVDGGAEAEVKVRSWSMSYGNGLDTSDVVLGSRSLNSLEEGNASASFTFRPAEALEDHFRRALAADPEAVKLRLTATGALIGGAVSYKLEVIAYLLEYLSAPANISAAERLNAVEVQARAAYDDSASKFVTVELVNEVASY